MLPYILNLFFYKCQFRCLDNWKIELSFTNRLISLTSINLVFSIGIILSSILNGTLMSEIKIWRSVRTTNNCANNMIYIQK